MALVSKSKAAKLAGVSRTTIHRYINEGKLSESGGQIDTSELIRVFGVISEQAGTPVTVNNSGHDVTGDVQGVYRGQIDQLEAQIRDIREDRDRWRERADQMTDLLRAEQENIKLITHQGSNKRDGDRLIPIGVTIATTLFALLVLAVMYLSGRL